MMPVVYVMVAMVQMILVVDVLKQVHLVVIMPVVLDLEFDDACGVCAMVLVLMMKVVDCFDGSCPSGSGNTCGSAALS